MPVPWLIVSSCSTLSHPSTSKRLGGCQKMLSSPPQLHHLKPFIHIPHIWYLSLKALEEILFNSNPLLNASELTSLPLSDLIYHPRLVASFIKSLQGSLIIPHPRFPICTLASDSPHKVLVRHLPQPLDHLHTRKRFQVLLDYQLNLFLCWPLKSRIWSIRIKP